MTSHAFAVFGILQRALNRLRRHAWSLLAAGAVVVLGRLSISLFLTPEIAERLTAVGVIALVLFHLALWVGFLSFALALLARDGHRTDILADFPLIVRRCLSVGGRLLWHTWLLAALIGSLTLFIHPTGFRPSVLLLWTIAVLVAVVRGPRAALAPVIALEERPHRATTAIERSRELTRTRWPTVALLLAVIAGLTLACGRLLALMDLQPLLLPLNLAGQALGLAAIVELKHTLTRG